MTRVKICGLSDPDTLDAALDGGADYVGFVHFPPSPRHVDLAQGGALARRVRGRATRVLLLVDPDDALLAEALPALDPDLIQLHGREDPARVAAIRARYGRPVMKALGVATRDDLACVPAYADAADHLLLDAKPPPGAALPGGNGRAFDWSVLAGALDPALPFMLSGGLDPGTVAAAIAVARPAAVDVSSGVEHRPGVKDPARIAAFVAAVRAASRETAPDVTAPQVTAPRAEEARA